MGVGGYRWVWERISIDLLSWQGSVVEALVDPIRVDIGLGRGEVNGRRRVSGCPPPICSGQGSKAGEG